ncbi:TniQ family protein [Paramagnetospirillum kuznetsovii]|uniref:TniQ family protein n=1 Tax=Paramagnetospirillum kuznetsovii TaxID=2053833 RepID=UPI001374C550|nr:TniQ family protein [Paramagnetospirillum kuznetsovii]
MLQSDELLSSWLRRIEAYYCIHGSLTRYISRGEIDAPPSPRSPLTLASPTYLDVNPSPDWLAWLAKLTNCSAAILASHTLAHDHRNWPLHWFASTHFSLGSPLIASAPGYCPLCFYEMAQTATGIYLRREWTLTYSTMCRRHSVPLLTWPESLRLGPGLEDWERTTTVIVTSAAGDFTANVDQYSILGWRWLTELEQALIATMDGGSLSPEWGGPGNGEQLDALLCDLVDQWGHKAWPRQRAGIATIAPRLMGLRDIDVGHTDGKSLCVLSPDCRRRFVSGLMGPLLGRERWGSIDDTRPKFGSARDTGRKWPGESALRSGYRRWALADLELRAKRWPKGFRAMITAMVEQQTQSDAATAAKKAVRHAQAKAERDAGKAGRQIKSKGAAKSARWTIVRSRPSGGRSARLSSPAKAPVIDRCPQFHPDDPYLRLAHQVLSSDEGRRALKLKGVARDRALDALMQAAAGLLAPTS